MVVGVLDGVALVEATGAQVVEEIKVVGALDGVEAGMEAGVEAGVEDGVLALQVNNRLLLNLCSLQHLVSICLSTL